MVSPAPTPSPATTSALKGETTIADPGRAAAALARRTAEARATIPDLELETVIDAGALITRQRETACSRSALLLSACAAALRGVPRANAAYRDGRYELYSRINVAFAVTTDDAQLTPTILDADQKSLGQLNAEIDDLTARARAGELTPPELAGATFTLCDLGELGPHRWTLPLTPPQAAMLTAGSIRAAAVVRDGAVVAGQELQLTLACDHRILFGTRAAEFLSRIAERLEDAGP